MMWTLVSLAFGADEVVYAEGLGPNWYDWSWTSTVDFAATGDAHTGQLAMLGILEGNGGLSIQRASGLGTASALRFHVKGQGDSVVLRIESVAEGARAPDQPLTVRSDEWTEYTISLDSLPALAWDRIAWVDTSGLGATVRVDDVELLDEDPAATTFTALEPIPPDRLLLYGAGDVPAVTVSLDGAALPIASSEVEGGPTRTYLTLDAPLGPGELVVTTPDRTFTRNIGTAAVTVAADVTHVISSTVYGANFPDWPPSRSEMERYGYGAVRWGGNARALYNPSTNRTNVGADFFFLNVTVDPDVQRWAGLIDVDKAITVPNLDWVADGTNFWQYSVETYGPQEAVAPFEPDAGNGIAADGSLILDNDPNDASVPWTSGDTRDWLTGLDFTPSILAIGNETDIAHIAHQGVHPDPATYQEQLDRFLDHANAAKDVLPDVPVSGPVGCCWYFYWNSGNPADASQHGDFLPWFLDRVAAHDQKAGRRTLDLLDLHYYPEGLITYDWKNESDPVIDQWRLRATRSLWDPSFVDDSWVGTNPPVTDQPNPDRVQLLPRLRTLLDEHYPGTGLAITEWSFGADGTSGGLATADALGIFGREAVDWAFVWPGPVTGGPVAAAFELYRGGDLRFGSSSLPVTGFDPDRLGVYASRRADGSSAIVIVNKSPDEDVRLDIDGVAPGRLQAAHFGSTVGSRVIDHPSVSFDGTVTVPAYSAVILVVGASDDGTPPEPPEAPENPESPGGPADPTVVGGRACNCTATGLEPVVWLIFGLVPWVRRRRRA